jgi:predicted ATP-dependent endonuclease of OLD family
MELQLKNIGMIKEANVKIDGLTVIAGENDTGKSTVARELHYEATSVGSMGRFPIKFNRAKLKIQENESTPDSVILIDTPNSLDTFSFIKNATLLIHQQRLNIHLSMFRVDLILQLSQDILEKNEDNYIYRNIEKLIEGRVFYDKNKDEILYEKYSLENKIFKMENTSNGIKMFGFLQILLLNEAIRKDAILILDEPEVHLHPKWQLKYAEVIVELVKNGVKVLVNSHSPYMIEALKRYSEVEEIEDKTNFYLAEDGYIEYQESLEDIFEKLVLPIRELKKLKMDRYLNDKDLTLNL